MYDELEKPLRELALSEPLAQRARGMIPPVAATAPNGIKVLRVVSVDKTKNEAHLEVHFFNRNYLNAIVNEYNGNQTKAKNIFPIAGGSRLRAGSALGQVQVDSSPSPLSPSIKKHATEP